MPIKSCYRQSHHCCSKGIEEYDELKESLTNVINDVNSLVDDGGITVDGKTVKLE